MTKSASEPLPTTAAEIERMRAASGAVTSRDPLVALLYLIARDRMPVGDLDILVDQAATHGGGRTTYTNGWLARWAIDRAAALRRSRR